MPNPDATGPADLLRDRILEDALEIEDETARSAFVEAECRGDRTLRAEIERLLGLDVDLDTFLEAGPRTEFASTRLQAGIALGRYRIEHEIACGGSGRVYRARDPLVGRAVAVKVMFGGSDWEAAERFQRELQMLGAVSHENVVRLYDFGDFEGSRFLVTEFLDGEDLGKAIQNKRCGDIAARLEIGRQIVSGLWHIHEAGIVHRDLKPSNVFLLRNGGVKLIDFGIAHKLDLTSTFARLTKHGLLSGTPTHTAPERIRGEGATVASDVYALGITLYELLPGVPAFRGTSLRQLFDTITEEGIDLRPLSESGAPDAVTAFIAQCASRNASERPVKYAEEYRLALAACGQPNERAAAQVAREALTCDQLEQLTARLTAVLGPIAKLLVAQAARRHKSARELCLEMAEQIPSTEVRRAFLRDTLAASGAARQPASGGSWDGDTLALATMQLTSYIGPIANVLVARAARRAGSFEELKAALAAEIPSDKDRARFARTFSLKKV